MTTLEKSKMPFLILLSVSTPIEPIVASGCKPRETSTGSSAAAGAYDGPWPSPRQRGLEYLERCAANTQALQKTPTSTEELRNKVELCSSCKEQLPALRAKVQPIYDQFATLRSLRGVKQIGLVLCHAAGV